MKRAIENYYATEMFFATAISQASLTLEGRKLSAHFTGVDSEHLNMVIQKERLHNQSQAFESVADFFAQFGVKWAWTIQGDLVDETFLKSIESAGYVWSDEITVMECDLRHKDFKNEKSKLKIQECSNSMRDWGAPLVKAFESTEEICAQYIQAHSKGQKGLYHYVGFWKGEPISALTLSVHKGLARLDDVGTLPVFQRQGYASELIQWTLENAKIMGATMCYLGASSQGLSVYQQLGFDALFNIQIFQKKR